MGVQCVKTNKCVGVFVNSLASCRCILFTFSSFLRLWRHSSKQVDGRNFCVGVTGKITSRILRRSSVGDERFGRVGIKLFASGSISTTAVYFYNFHTTMSSRSCQDFVFSSQHILSCVGGAATSRWPGLLCLPARKIALAHDDDASILRTLYFGPPSFV